MVRVRLRARGPLLALITGADDLPAFCRARRARVVGGRSGRLIDRLVDCVSVATRIDIAGAAEVGHAIHGEAGARVAVAVRAPAAGAVLQIAIHLVQPFSLGVTPFH